MEPHERLREIRRERGLTQADLAARLGTTPSVISMMESGGRALTLKWIELLAAVLRVAPSSFLSDEVPPETVITPEVSAMLAKFFGVGPSR
jgi:transcriptional regulator with XRE-family HTH domain